MRFVATPLAGACVVEPELAEDERGFFARTYCREEFRRQGLDPELSQCSISFNRARHTLRGLHYQAAPHAEAKLVRCTRGAVFDVVVDLRAGSPTRHRWFAVELNEDNRKALYVPEGLAHGFLTLSEGAEVLYQISRPYEAASARGVRWDDATLAIDWPAAPAVISARDRALPAVQI